MTTHPDDAHPAPTRGVRPRTAATFRSTVPLPHDLHVVTAEGEEAISGLFRVDVLLSVHAPLDAATTSALVGAPAAVALGAEPGELMCGVIATLVRVHVSAGETRYRVRIEPTLGLLRHTRRRRAFVGVDVPSMVARILDEHGLDHAYVRQHLGAVYEKRTYCAQMEESDLAFVERWLAEEGLYYWFSHGENGEVLEIADGADVAASSQLPTRLRYVEETDLEMRDETVFDLEEQWTVGPGQVVHHHVDESRAHTAIVHAASGAAQVWGAHVHFGGVRPRDDDALARWTQRRAEAVTSDAVTCRARTHAPRVRAGSIIEVVDGPVGRFFLVTSSRFRLGHATHLHHAGEDDGWQRYTATLDLVDVARPYRPAPHPRPQVGGVFVGYVVADDGCDDATPDAEGRYRVTLPWVSPGDGRTATSAPLRVMQMAAGASEGSAFPLRQGTPVLLAHEGGDPDRPVILGAVPHGLTRFHHETAATAFRVENAVGVRLELENRVKHGESR